MISNLIRWDYEMGFKNRKLGMPYKVISYEPKFENSCKHHKYSFYAHVDWHYNDRVYDLYFLTFEEKYSFGEWLWCARYDDLDCNHSSGSVSSMTNDQDFMIWFVDYQDRLGRRKSKNLLRA